MTDADPVITAHRLTGLLPSLIDQAIDAGPALAMAAYGLRTALAEAQRVADEAHGQGSPITSLRQLLCRLGG